MQKRVICANQARVDNFADFRGVEINYIHVYIHIYNLLVK